MLIISFAYLWMNDKAMLGGNYVVRHMEEEFDDIDKCLRPGIEYLGVSSM